MNDVNGYVRKDEHGVYRVDSTRVMLDGIVASFQEGLSPESIVQEFPALTLEQVYGAITYYLGHQEEVHAYLKEQDRLWERLRAESGQDNLAVVRRLRGIHDGVPQPQ
jgi:uncharacterized protein (DUF433 family)